MARSVHHEAVRQQAVVGRATIERAGGQQRGMEPAAVLVGALEVEVGRPLALAGVAAAQHRPVRRAGIEPDVERVAHLVVLCCLGAQQLGRVEPEPGIDALLLDALRHLLEQFRRARMQLSGLLVQEEGDRHAPVALARDAPVRAVGDHGVQARLAPVGEKFRRFDGSQRRLAQGAALDRLAIHADEPLAGGAIDDRRLVAPAMHVAVGDLVRGEQAADFAQLLDDGGVGLPDVEAAEEGQALGKAAVALHRREDLLVAHAVALAGLEVLQTVGRRAVHHARAGVQRDVVA